MLCSVPLSFERVAHITEPPLPPSSSSRHPPQGYPRTPISRKKKTASLPLLDRSRIAQLIDHFDDIFSFLFYLEFHGYNLSFSLFPPCTLHFGLLPLPLLLFLLLSVAFCLVRLLPCSWIASLVSILSVSIPPWPPRVRLFVRSMPPYTTLYHTTPCHIHHSCQYCPSIGLLFSNSISIFPCSPPFLSFSYLITTISFHISYTPFCYFSLLFHTSLIYLTYLTCSTTVIYENAQAALSLSSS